MSTPILLIGGTLLDIKGKPLAGLEPSTSNPARIKHVRGGTARNVAENLARLGAEAILISAVGDDYTGRQLVGQTAAANVNVEHVQLLPNERTGTYVAILNEDGDLSVAMDDVSVLKHITPQFLYQRRRLFKDAGMILVDGSLTDETLAMATRLSSQYNTPLCADPSSTRLAQKLCPYLSQIDLIVPNEAEAAIIVEQAGVELDLDDALDIAAELVGSGIKHAIVTLSNHGLAYATSDETGVIPPRYSEFVDSTGTGDALTAAVIYGLLEGLPAIEAIRLGAAAASLTIQTDDTVVPDLSLDMLYHHLIG